MMISRTHALLRVAALAMLALLTTIALPTSNAEAGCMPGALAAKLNQIRAKFGPVQVISTSYSCGMHHIHIDTGPRVRFHKCQGSGSRYASRSSKKRYAASHSPGHKKYASRSRKSKSYASASRRAKQYTAAPHRKTGRYAAAY